MKRSDARKRDEKIEKVFMAQAGGKEIVGCSIEDIQAKVDTLDLPPVLYKYRVYQMPPAYAMGLQVRDFAEMAVEGAVIRHD